MASTSPKQQPFRFLDLSAEVRLQIYEYLLIKGKIFFSPDEYTLRNEYRYQNKNGYLRPQLHLLRVCKQIHAEAEGVYLSKNLFVLPDYFMFHDPINWNKVQNAGLGNDGAIIFPSRPLFSENAAQHLQNISIALNARRPCPAKTINREHWAYNRQRKSELSWDNMDAQRRMQLAHDVAKSAGNYNYVEIDITEAYGPIGCCRMTQQIAPLLAATYPTHVVIRGAWDQKEKDEILAGLEEFYKDWENEDDRRPYRGMTREQIGKMHRLEFDPEGDIWEKWKMVGKPRKSKVMRSIPQR